MRAYTEAATLSLVLELERQDALVLRHVLRHLAGVIDPVNIPDPGHVRIYLAIYREVLGALDREFGPP